MIEPGTVVKCADSREIYPQVLMSILAHFPHMIDERDSKLDQGICQRWKEINQCLVLQKDAKSLTLSASTRQAKDKDFHSLIFYCTNLQLEMSSAHIVEAKDRGAEISPQAVDNISRNQLRDFPVSGRTVKLFDLLVNDCLNQLRNAAPEIVSGEQQAIKKAI